MTNANALMNIRRVAIQDGQETWAEKVGGRWLIGGDRPSGRVSILLARNGLPAWFSLNGCFLKFEDWD
jgi:hypothetical protein